MKYLFVLLLASCGRDCSVSVEQTAIKTFGSLESVRCDDGEVLISFTPNWLPGGVVTSIEARCGRVRNTCQ
jgi:hypothetical protein